MFVFEILKKYQMLESARNSKFSQKTNPLNSGIHTVSFGNKLSIAIEKNGDGKMIEVNF